MAIIVPIIADTSGLTRGLSKGSSGLKRFGKIAAGVAGVAALGGLVATVKVGIDEFMEAQKVMAQTGAVLKSTGGAAKVTATQITDLSSSIMRMTGIDDEAIQSGQNLLLTFTKIRNETGKGNDIFNQATLAMTDLSVAMGKDLNSSAILVGKALNDPVKGVGALSKAGVQFTADQKDMIKEMVESGNVMGAQKMILKELETQFEGSAEAAGKTLAGQLNILKQTFSNLAGELVGKFMPSVTKAATKVVEFLLDMSKQPTLKAKLEIITGSVSAVWDSIKSWWSYGEPKELPSGIVVGPPGKQQVEEVVAAMLASIRRSAKTGSEELGFQITAWIFRGMIKEAEDKGDRASGSLIKSLLINLDALKFGAQIAEDIIDGIQRYFEESKITFGDIVLKWLRVPDDTPLRSAIGLGQKLADAVSSGAIKEKPNVTRALTIDPFVGIVTTGKKNKLTEVVRAAVQDARRQLQSLGSSILGLVTSGRAQMAIGGGRTPAAMLADQRKIEDERYAIEESRLKAISEASDATEDDKLSYRELVLGREQAIRERALQDQEQTDKKSVDNLIEQFNRGEISADAFRTELTKILGTDFGTELGIGFSEAFKREFETIISLATDIFDRVGGQVPIAAEAPTPVSAALQAENQRRFEEDLAAYKKRRADRLTMAENARKRADSAGGKTITPAERKEIDDIMKFWDAQEQNKRPQRSAYGLARGGILKQPTFVAGEAGREAVIPLESSSAMKILRDAIGGGGGSTVVYNLVVNAGLGTDPDDLGRTIVESIKRYEKRNGAVFQGPIVTTLANAAGKTSTASAATDFNRAKTLRSG
jgi:hypothetical protein